MKCALVLTILASLLWLASKKVEAPSVIVFTNATIVDARNGGKLYPHMTVVVKAGTIAEIGSKIKFDRRARVIDAEGKFLISGLWDMHTHTGFIQPRWDEKVIYPLYIANGITGIRDMGGDLEQLLRRRQEIERGEVLGPHMLMAGPFLAAGKGDAQTISVTNPGEARDAVDTLKSRGVDFIKVLNLDRDSYLAVAQEAEKVGLAFVGHVPVSVSAAEASDTGQRSIEHLTGISLACSSDEDKLRAVILQARKEKDWPAYFSAGKRADQTFNSKKAAELFGKLAANHTWQVPTLVWTQAQVNLDSTTLGADRRLRYVPASVRERWNSEELLKETPPEQLAEYKRDAVQSLELVGQMHHAGVQFMAGSDGPDPFVFPGFSLHDELELLVKSGFSPAEALQAATYDPAAFLGKLDKYGTLEKGRVAEIVVLQDNPLLDIRNTRRIEGVMVDGHYYSRPDLDRILEQVETLAAQE